MLLPKRSIQSSVSGLKSTLNVSGWFAREQIWTKPNTWLATNGKLNSLGLVKEMLKNKFRDQRKCKNLKI
jgi:hypothetical protein